MNFGIQKEEHSIRKTPITLKNISLNFTTLIGWHHKGKPLNKRLDREGILKQSIIIDLIYFTLNKLYIESGKDWQEYLATMFHILAKLCSKNVVAC